MSPIAENVIQRLDRARQRWWLFSLLTTVVLAGCVSFGVFLGLMAADASVRLSQAWLSGLAAAWLLATFLLMLGIAWRLSRGHRDMEAAARRVEMACPELGSDLINVVQFSRVGARTHAPGASIDGVVASNHPTNLVFCQAAVRDAAAHAAAVAFERAAVRQSRWRRLASCMQTPRDLAESLLVLALLVAIAMAGNRWMPNWHSAAARLLAPWEFVPSVGSVEITRVTPGSAEVLAGESVEIAAEVRGPDDKPQYAVLVLMRDDGQQSTLAMTEEEQSDSKGTVPFSLARKSGQSPDATRKSGQSPDHRRYRATVSSVLRPFRYRLEIGDSQTAIYSIGVAAMPAVESVEITYRYPAYLGRDPETATQTTLDLEAPQYTVAELRFRLSGAVAKGHLESDRETFPGRVEPGGKLLAASMPLLENGSYRVRLFNEAGRSDPTPRPNRITVQPDKPPVVELVRPAAQNSATPGAAIPIVIRATDDHGLGRIELQVKIESAAGEKEEAESLTTVKQWADFRGDAVTAAVRRHTLQLDRAAAGPGKTVLVRAIAWDKRWLTDWGLDLKPQQTATAWHAIKIVAAEAASAATLAQLEGLRDALWKLLEKQVQARTSAEVLVKGREFSGRIRAAGDVRVRQIEIQMTSAELAKSLIRLEAAEPRAVRKALDRLAVGDMLQAVASCDEMLKLKSASAFAQPASSLIVSQNHIIDVLRKLLDLVRHARADVLAEMKHRPDTALPDDVKRKLEELRKKLDKLLAQQRKVIEASENLAKRPVEDFTKAEEELLKGLAAAEEDFAKFMGEVQSDLSKLPEQDFADPSVARELVEIQTELKMAEDALTKKSVDIAVPLEQLGYERAEELKTDFEKWLPDSPDREKWSQEESLADKDKEAPMAELPGELEDLVGELMEQEEDLFDEMEDVSSSAADSLDKGAGWDAMDGPISNTSAKGVTGNRLPNTSEIGGRSGEGRQGKAAGEYVGDEAVGKGGRKTPTRLTPDPVVKGRIKDRNKQAPGGATGGGKQSGQGGEGLQGPVPRNGGPRNSQRLADRQATLRNKAEGVDLRFQVLNFHRTDLKKMIDAMAKVEQDLRSGRYRNALRERDVLLDGLRNIEQYLEGEVEVRQDATSNLPADIQKKILGSMTDASPPGWEELNQRYFERLGGDRAKKGEGAGGKPAAK